MESFLAEHVLFVAGLGAAAVAYAVKLVLRALVLALILGAGAAGAIIHYLDKWDYVAGLIF